MEVYPPLLNIKKVLQQAARPHNSSFLVPWNIPLSKYATYTSPVSGRAEASFGLFWPLLASFGLVVPFKKSQRGQTVVSPTYLPGITYDMFLFLLTTSSSYVKLNQPNGSARTLRHTTPRHVTPRHGAPCHAAPSYVRHVLRSAPPVQSMLRATCIIYHQ